MIGKTVALIQVPNQRLFSTRAAAQYLGICEDSLCKHADLGDIPTRRLGRRRLFTLEDLDAFMRLVGREKVSPRSSRSSGFRALLMGPKANPIKNVN